MSTCCTITLILTAVIPRTQMEVPFTARAVNTHCLVKDQATSARVNDGSPQFVTVMFGAQHQPNLAPNKSTQIHLYLLFG